VEHPHRIAILVIVVSLSLICPSAHGGIAPHWTADYRVLFDGTDYFGAGQDFVIASAALSADGSTAAIGGYHANDSTWFVIVMPTNGGPGTTVALPVDPHPDRPTMRIQNLCLDSDGSRVFVITPWYQYRIYRIESGTATEVVNYTDYAYLSMPTDGIVRTTSTGEWVYFNEDRDDLYRVAHTGGVPERVLDDASITTSDGHTGWAIGDFEISSDGASAAFIMSGYTTKSPAAVVRYDAYSLVSGTVHQLTLDSTSEGHVAMSDDGSTVAFKGAGGWTAAAADGSDTRALIGASHNVAGCDLSGDGSAMVYSDANANGGRLVPTDGSGELDIFPDWSPRLSRRGVQLPDQQRRIRRRLRIHHPEVLCRSSEPRRHDLPWPVHLRRDPRSPVSECVQPHQRHADAGREPLRRSASNSGRFRRPDGQRSQHRRLG
jgi:hypothetical protein